MSAPDYIAMRIAPKFGVSVEVIAKRLRAEKLWPPNWEELECAERATENHDRIIERDAALKS